MGVASYRYEFGEFALDQRSWSLTGADGEPIRLTPKVFDALLILLEHAGEVVDRQTLYDALWPDSIVEENNLRQVIAALRRALGEELIRTVPRRGYQLVAEVRLVAADDADEKRTIAPQRGRGSALVAMSLLAFIGAAFWHFAEKTPEPTSEIVPMLAVLPFTDTSPEGNLEHIADAVALELLTTLSLIDGLNVPGSTSSFYFKDNPADLATVRELLHADYLLEGDIRSARESLRVSVRLTDAASGVQIWSESYDSSVDQFFELQDEIAFSTAQALEIALGVGERGNRLGTTRNVTAYFQYIEAGRILREGDLFSPTVIRAALPYLEQAVALDENFSLAWFDLYYQLYWLEILGAESASTVARAEYALNRVEELTPNLPELVFAKIETSTDAYELARVFETFLSDASTANYPPSILLDIEARFLRFTGRVRESALVAERARVLDPLNDALTGFIAEGYAAEGRFQDALDLLDESSRRNGAAPGPNAFVIALESGNRDEIDKHVAPLRSLPSGITRSLAENFDAPEQALELLRSFAASPEPAMLLWPSQLAPWAAWFGDAELALQMYTNEVPYALANTVSRPIFAEMRRLPGFKLLVRDIGLLSYWRESGHWPDYCRPVAIEDFECF